MYAGTSNSASCKQNELLSLAGEVSSHVSVSDLARCLEISLDNVNASTDRDKIYTMFLLWMSANHAAAKNSMATLLTLLERLNNASVDNVIKKYRDSEGKSYYNIFMVFNVIIGSELHSIM